MFFLEKVEYKKAEFPFCYIKDKDDIEAGGISIEAYGEVDGMTKYLYITFILSDPKMYDSNDYEDMIRILKEVKEKKVVVNLKYKKERVVGFELDKEALANNLKDERFNKIEILCTGINAKSVIHKGV